MRRCDWNIYWTGLWTGGNEYIYPIRVPKREGQQFAQETWAPFVCRISRIKLIFFLRNECLLLLSERYSLLFLHTYIKYIFIYLKCFVFKKLGSSSISVDMSVLYLITNLCFCSITFSHKCTTFLFKKCNFRKIAWRISCYDFKTILKCCEILKRMLLNVSITHIHLHIYGFSYRR